jgi:hypothetical protein
MDHITVDMTLTSGGGVYALSPIVTQVNPNGALPFVFVPGNDSFVN